MVDINKRNANPYRHGIYFDQILKKKKTLLKCVKISSKLTHFEDFFPPKLVYILGFILCARKTMMY